MLKKITWLGWVVGLHLSLAFAQDTIVPFGNNIWVHGYQYNGQNTMTFSKSAYFLDQLSAYNRGAGPGHQLTELSVYGATINIIPPKSGPYLPNNFQFTYYPSRPLGKVDNNWQNWAGQFDAGFRSVHDYAHLTIDGKPKGQRVLNLIDINGEVGYRNTHGTYYLNGLDQVDAAHLAAVVAAQMCADDVVDGAVFDIEPFNFGNETGVIHGYGQKFFYNALARDFAGQSTHNTPDPMHCVDATHPQGRIFAIYTSGQTIAPQVKEIAKVLTQYGNGYVIYGLYDLGGDPAHFIADSPASHAQEVKAEISTDKQQADQYQIPYQFAIAAAASATQFESVGAKSSGYQQVDYVKADLAAIEDSGARQDPLFKGMMLYMASEVFLAKDPSQPGQMLEIKPANIFSDQEHAVVPYLQQNL